MGCESSTEANQTQSLNIDKSASQSNVTRTTFKIIIVGEASVGKTCLTYRYVTNSFENKQPTVGASFMAVKRMIGNCEVKLELWDTAGQERFKCLSPMYFRNADVALLVYDITHRETFKVTAKDSWQLAELRKAAPQCNIILVGNKSDIEEERQVALEEAEEVASKNNWPVIEASAKEDYNVQEVFEQVLKAISLKPDFASKSARALPL